MPIQDISTDELIKMSQSPSRGPGIGSVPTEVLLQQRQAISQPQVDEQSTLDLIGQMSGRLPSQQLPPKTAALPGTFAFAENPEFAKEQNRRAAFAQLTEQGFSPEQINTVINIQKRVNPGIVQSIKENIGAELGGLGGGIAGAKIAGLVGQIPPLTAFPEEFVTVPLFSGAGAFIGGGAGKTAQQAIDPLESPSARDFLIEGGKQAAFEAGGRLAGPLLRSTGLGKRTNEAVEVAKERFKLADGFFTPAQRDPRIVNKAAEQLSRGSFGGGPIFAANNLSQQAQALQISDDIIKKVVGGQLDDPKVLGDEIAGIFTRLGEKGQQVKGVRQTLLDTFFDDLYKQIDVISPNASFTTEPIKKFAQNQLDENVRLGGALLTGEGKKRMKNIVSGLPESVSADEMRKLRSLYTADARRFQLTGDQSSTGFSKLAEVADDVLFDPGAEAGLNDQARTLLRNINAVYGPGKQLYEETVVKEMVRKLNTNPTLINTIIGEKPDPKNLKTLRELLVSPVRKVSGSGQSTKTIAKELRAAKSALKNPEAIALLQKNTSEGKRLWKQLQGSWLENQVKGSIDPSTGLISAKKLDKAIKGMNPESFKVLFPGEIGKDVKALSGLIATITPEKAGLSTLFGKGIEFSGAGAIGSGLSAGSGARILKGGVLSIGPSLYAKIATNPRATNVPALTARLIDAINQDVQKDQKKIAQERRQIIGKARKQQRVTEALKGLEQF
jgi:hypothetical protein